MKKKIAGIFLTAVLTVTAAGFGVAGVSADEAQSDTEAVAVDEASEAADTESRNADAEADPENAAELTGSTSKEDEEEGTDKVVESGSEEVEQGAETEVTGMKVILINDLGTDLSSVEVKSFSADEYSENLLKNDTIFRAGESCTIGIPETVQDPDLEMYDVRITSTDGQITEIPLVPFIEGVTGTLCTEEGTVLIKIRDERLEAEEDASGMSEIEQKEELASEARSEALAAEAAAEY